MSVAQEVYQGGQSANGVSASKVIKTGKGRLGRVSVTTAGAVGAVYDSATVGGVGASNLIGTVPATVGIYDFDWPFYLGLVYVPGASQVASLTYS